MEAQELAERNFESEFIFSASRSSGPGGQNVNKVSSKIELRINLQLTTLLSDEEKKLVYRKLRNKINTDGELILVSQSERTQLLNKEVVIEKFYTIMAQALTLPLKRRSTRPTFASKVKRLEKKRSRASIKKLRKDPGESTD
jgi:ribosome-associated protein